MVAKFIYFICQTLLIHQMCVHMITTPTITREKKAYCFYIFRPLVTTNDLCFIATSYAYKNLNTSYTHEFSNVKEHSLTHLLTFKSLLP